MHAAALAACDAADGSQDGIIGDPEHCHFNPAATLCHGADSSACLTEPQVAAARRIYAGPHNPRTHVEIYSPMYPGSELGWGCSREAMRRSQFRWISSAITCSAIRNGTTTRDP